MKNLNKSSIITSTSKAELNRKFEHMLGFKFSNEEKEYLSHMIHAVQFEKGDIPVHEGDEMKNFYFIISGLVRGYYIDEDGNEVTKCFSCENQVFSTECYRTMLSSSFYVECIEDCDCIEVPYIVLEKWKILSETIQNLYVKEVEKLEKRVRGMLLMNATQRYENFCMEYKSVMERIPLKYVASFIGIKAESLSRIRHEKMSN